MFLIASYDSKFQCGLFILPSFWLIFSLNIFLSPPSVILKIFNPNIPNLDFIFIIFLLFIHGVFPTLHLDPFVSALCPWSPAPDKFKSKEKNKSKKRNHLFHYTYVLLYLSPKTSHHPVAPFQFPGFHGCSKLNTQN